MEIGIEDTSTELGFMWMELGEHPFYLKNGTEDGWRKYKERKRLG
jgi:hypothetical protein